jgi:hypothetical protein
MKLTTHLHLVLRLRLCGAIPPPLNMSSRRGVQVNHRDNFIFTLNSGNAYYYTVHNLLSPYLSKEVMIKLYRTVTLPVALYGCET